MEKRFLQILILGVFLFAIWEWCNPLWRSDLNEAVDPDSNQKIVFSIEKGSTAKQIAKGLAKENLIVSASSFLKDVEELELSSALRYGSFVLSPSMTLTEIVTILSTEGTGELAITVPEGWTITQIDAKLTEMGLIEAGTFISCTINCKFSFEFIKEGINLEGYLFPDTYFIDSANFEAESFVEQMLRNFENKWTDEMQSVLKNSGRTLDQVVTVASMLEREVRTEQDLALVSGIIWKRLDNDWTLGIDATLLYRDEDGQISAQDLTNDSPYNTRKNTGLPPTAIGNPGLATLKAALYPEASNYWFYLTDTEANVHYAVTNEEHEENKTKYLD